MTVRRLRLGISPCPNDTFAFHGLLSGRVQPRGVELELLLADVEELNARLLDGDLSVAKGSFHAALSASDRLGVLPVGSALGFGNGPLLLAREPGAVPDATSRVLAPGRWTTATLLYRTFHPAGAAPRHVVFSEILPALERGEADFGVCIHEARFTYERHGLACVEDLGARWERATGSPLPLGGIFARRDLPTATLRAITQAIADSLDHARAHPDEALGTMRAHAVELDDDVLRAHVALYVNEHTRELGGAGRRAVRDLDARAMASGALPAGRPPLAVLGAPRLFHLAPAAAWAAAAGGPWRPPSLAAEGFVHLSFAHQLAGTLRAHFAGSFPLTLLELDPERLADALRLEASRGGALFPHLFRALEAADVVRSWDLAPGAAAPALGLDASEDAPAGRPSDAAAFEAR